MKRIFFVVLLSTLSYTTFAQQASVENSSSGVQTGFLGIWIYNEWGVSSQLAVRTEVGLDAAIFADSFVNKSGLILTPTLHVEPRWYYNLNKRERKSRNTRKNSGNFVSLKTVFRPGWFALSNLDGVEVIPNLALVPTWGIRRHLGSNFNYEVGIGIGAELRFCQECRIC